MKNNAGFARSGDLPHVRREPKAAQCQVASVEGSPALLEIADSSSHAPRQPFGHALLPAATGNESEANRGQISCATFSAEFAGLATDVQDGLISVN